MQLIKNTKNQILWFGAIIALIALAWFYISNNPIVDEQSVQLAAEPNVTQTKPASTIDLQSGDHATQSIKVDNYVLQSVSIESTVDNSNNKD